MYKNEAFFSRALVTAMKSRGMFVQRIESGETGKGIPDIFAITQGVPMWIELKRIHTTCSDKHTVTITWRPGQQAWLHEVSRRGMVSFTLACFDDGILKIPSSKLFLNNVVPIFACKYYKNISALLN